MSNCKAEGCTRHVQQSIWGCHKHWSMLTPEIRNAIWRLHVAGEPPSVELKARFYEATELVARKEGRR